MVANWKTYCRIADLQADGDGIDVQLADGRRHRVTIEESEDSLFLSAFVVRQAVVAELSDLPVTTWLRNRVTAIVGFRIDRVGRLIGEAAIPQAGLSAEEFGLYVRTVAEECDRFEYVLSGRDVE